MIDAERSREAVQLVNDLEPELQEELLNYLAGKHPGIVLDAIDYFVRGEAID